MIDTIYHNLSPFPCQLRLWLFHVLETLTRLQRWLPRHSHKHPVVSSLWPLLQCFLPTYLLPTDYFSFKTQLKDVSSRKLQWGPGSHFLCLLLTYLINILTSPVMSLFCLGRVPSEPHPCLLHSSLLQYFLSRDKLNYASWTLAAKSGSH